VFQDEDTPRTQQRRSAGSHRCRQIESVGPSPVQRDMRIVVAHFGVLRDLRRRDVRRVGDDDVDGAVELVQGLAGVGEDQLDLETQPVPVEFGPGECLRADLHGIHACPGGLVLDPEGDGARAGAQVDDHRGVR